MYSKYLTKLSGSKTKFWEFTVLDRGVTAQTIIRYGNVGGKARNTAKVFDQVKTDCTPYQQAVCEATKAMTQKLAEGYSEEADAVANVVIEEIDVVDDLAAEQIDEVQVKTEAIDIGEPDSTLLLSLYTQCRLTFTYPCFVQRLYNGIYCKASAMRGLYDDERCIVYNLPHLTSKLAMFDNELECYLFLPNKSLLDVYSALTDEPTSIQLVVYDVVSRASFEERFIEFARQWKSKTPIDFALTYLCYDISHVDECQVDFKAEGLHGMRVVDWRDSALNVYFDDLLQGVINDTYDV